MARTKLVSPLVLHAMKYFDSAARNRSFTRAAEELSVTQGAISQQIRGLEEQIGVKLFVRLPKGLTLTPEGDRLALVVAKILQGLEDELQAIQPHVTSKPLVIRTSPSFSMMWLMPRLNRFSENNRDIEIRLRGELFGMPASKMASEDVDAVLLYGHHPASNDLRVVPLMDEYLLPVVSPGYLEKNGPLEETDDLSSTALLHDDSPWEGAPPYAEWMEWIQQAIPRTTSATMDTVRHGHQFNLSQLAINAALLGRGVAMARASLITDELSREQLTPFCKVAVRSSAQYFLVLNANAGRQRALSLFEEWIVEECRQYVGQRRAILAKASCAC
jgi:LysR family transcriptional regulator, glycine cleavage system transcriptional activator